MRKKAHDLMWPGRPFKKEPTPAAQDFQRAGSLRQQPQNAAKSPHQPEAGVQCDEYYFQMLNLFLEDLESTLNER
jgi:hypothetical protein